MNFIAEFTVPADQFALYETLSTATDMIVEVKRVVSNSPDQMTPYFWASGDDQETFETVARDGPLVEDFMKIDELEAAYPRRRSRQQTVERRTDILTRQLPHSIYC